MITDFTDMEVMASDAGGEKRALDDLSQLSQSDDVTEATSGSNPFRYDANIKDKLRRSLIVYKQVHLDYPEVDNPNKETSNELLDHMFVVDSTEHQSWLQHVLGLRGHGIFWGHVARQIVALQRIEAVVMNNQMHQQQLAMEQLVAFVSQAGLMLPFNQRLTAMPPSVNNTPVAAITPTGDTPAQALTSSTARSAPGAVATPKAKLMNSSVTTADDIPSPPGMNDLPLTDGTPVSIRTDMFEYDDEKFQDAPNA